MREGDYIAFDLDGTLAKQYWPEDGPYDHRRIGAPLLWTTTLVKEYLSNGIEVRILTARVGPTNYNDHSAEEAREAIEAWCERHLGQKLKVQCFKDYHLARLFDDRATRVQHNTGLYLQDAEFDSAIKLFREKYGLRICD